MCMFMLFSFELKTKLFQKTGSAKKKNGPKMINSTPSSKSKSKAVTKSTPIKPGTGLYGWKW